MKKIGKLSINPEKVMRNEELVNLRGGYTGTCCKCSNGSYIGASSSTECSTDCNLLYGGSTSGTWQC